MNPKYARKDQSDILIIGDAILDRYLYGQTHRISPEAPVPVVLFDKEEQRPGGAANVAMNILTMGGRCSLISCIGTDTSGQQLHNLLVNEPFSDCALLKICKKTTVKLRVMAQNHHLLRIDYEDSNTPCDLQEIEHVFKQMLPKNQVVIFSDYGKGSLSLIADLLALVSKDKRTIVDPKGLDFNRYKGAHLLTPNLKEFESIVGECQSMAQRVERALRLKKELELCYLLITMGEKGMILFGDTGFNVIDVVSRQVHDVAGAGDTVIACLALLLSKGMPMLEATKAAAKAATLVVSKAGTACVSKDELEQILSS